MANVEMNPRAALNELFHKMHYPLPKYHTEDMIQERLIR